MNELREEHTLKRYNSELSHLHDLVLGMGRLVITQVGDALTAFIDRDLTLAHQIITRDNEVDQLEVAADDAIVTLVGRRSPLGSDLRRVMAMSKSVSDLERIGDEAAKIASAVTQLFGYQSYGPNSPLVRDINGMAAMAMSSLQSAVDLFEVRSEDQARSVIARHRSMDEEFQANLRRMLTYVMEDSCNVGVAISVILVNRSLERIGHYTQNLTEYAIFQAKGEDIRNQGP